MLSFPESEGSELMLWGLLWKMSGQVGFGVPSFAKQINLYLLYILLL